MWLHSMLYPQTFTILLNVRYNSLWCLTFVSVKFALGFWLYWQNSVVSLPTMNFSKWAFSWKFSETGCPVLSWIVSSFLAECALLREDVLHDEGQLHAMNPKNFFSGFPDRLRSAAPLFHSWEDQDRPQSCEWFDLDVSTGFPARWSGTGCSGSWCPCEDSPGLMKVKKTRTKAFLRSNSS